jgi:hypothetical protein
MTFFKQEARKGLKCQISGGFSYIYLCSYYYTYWSRGVWMYPMYYHFNWTQQLLMNGLVTFILPSACYLLGEKLAGTIWGELLCEGISHRNI